MPSPGRVDNPLPSSPARPAGTNYRLKLKVEAPGAGAKYYQAQVWQKLPAYGGAMELTSLDETSADQVQ